MTTPEDRLRTALRSGESMPLRPESIMRAARRRRDMGRARMGAALIALIVVCGFGVRLLTGSLTQTGVPSGSSESSPAASGPAVGIPQVPGSVSRSQADVIPGRTLLVFSERWCLVDSNDAREIACTARSDYMQRVGDTKGTVWLVMLAPSGPETAVLQVEQSAAWVSLQSSRVPGSQSLWVGVARSGDVSQEPWGIRALDSSGREVWRP